MARLLVLETSVIDGRICQPGEEVDYEGEYGANLTPVANGESKAPKGKSKVEKAEEDQPESLG